MEVGIDDCGWEEQRATAEEIMGELVNEGLKRPAGKVVLACFAPRG